MATIAVLKQSQVSDLGLRPDYIYSSDKGPVYTDGIRQWRSNLDELHTLPVWIPSLSEAPCFV